MDELCCVCNSEISSSTQCCQLYSDLDLAGKSLFCHRECFSCSVCQISLGLDSYQVIQDNILCCKDHKDSAANSEELFISELKKFKDYNIQVLSALEGETIGKDTLKNTQIDENLTTCVCTKHPFVKSVDGYWIECTSSDCPRRKITSSTFDIGSNSDIEANSKECRLDKPEEIYQHYFYGSKHWNFGAMENKIGPVIITIKQEFRQSRDYFRIMVRSSMHIIHGILSASRICTNRYNPEEVVQELANIMEINETFMPLKSLSAPADLLKMDKGSYQMDQLATNKPMFYFEAFFKEEYKVGVLYMKEDQCSEEQLFNNEIHSEAFEDFLNLLGERIRLRGFNKYRAGLDNAGDLTGTHSVYTAFNNNQIMFHVSTLLPFEANDAQKLQRKRHIGNDIVCIIFMEAMHTQFIPGCIKSNFIHTFIVVQVDSSSDPETYNVCVVSKDSVPPYKPFLTEQNVFKKGNHFREWLLTKVINGERICYRAPKFAKLHNRTRCQIMEDLIQAAEQSQESGVERKESLPFREHNRWISPNSTSPSSSFQDAVQERFQATEQLAVDFKALNNNWYKFGDVIFTVGKTKKRHFVAVRSVLASRSRVFYKMLMDSDSPTFPDAPLSPHQNGGSQSPTTSKRPSSWTRSSPLFPAASRSRKFSFEKFRRTKSEYDNISHNPVTLSSVTDLQEKARFMADKKQTLQECVVEEFDGDTFEVLLDYLQTGSCDITSHVLPGLLCAAEHYEVEDLRRTCLEHAHECINDHTVYEMLKAFDQYSGYVSLEILKGKVGSFLEQSSLLLVENEDICDLSEESLRFVLARQSKASDASKFAAIIEWSKHFCKKYDFQVRPVDIAQPLLNEFVNFREINSRQDLLQAVYSTGEMANDEVITMLPGNRGSVRMTEPLKVEES